MRREIAYCSQCSYVIEVDSGPLKGGTVCCPCGSCDLNAYGGEVKMTKVSRMIEEIGRQSNGVTGHVCEERIIRFHFSEDQDSKADQ